MASYTGIGLHYLRRYPAVPLSASFLLNRSLTGDARTDLLTVTENGQSLGAIVGALAGKVGIEGNQFATGGLTLAIFGGALATASVLWGYVLEFLRKQLIVSAEFDSRLDDVLSSGCRSDHD